MNTEIMLDNDRTDRIGFGEAIYCASKSLEQIATIVETLARSNAPALLTRLSADQHATLPEHVRARLDYDIVSRTAILGEGAPVRPGLRAAIVTAGTSDVSAAKEAQRTLQFNGIESALFGDVGVAGLWRLLHHLPAIRQHDAVIVAAGMDGALPSVVGGLIAQPVIALPTSVGYGVAEGGRAAVATALASCAPGVAVVNIDNGYGAACVVMRIFRLIHSSAPTSSG